MIARTLVAWLVALLCLLHPAPAQVTYPARPPEGTFILDQARLLTDADATAVAATCRKLMDDRTTPIIVVTITSLADQGARGIPIEQYARGLFDTWGIGSQQRNAGVLFLVSQGDRKARIELGGDWSKDADNKCLAVMTGVIIPRFKARDMSGGIRAGVEALDALVRGPLSGGATSTAAIPSTTTTAPVRFEPPPRATTPTPQPVSYGIPSPSSTLGLGGILAGCGGVPLFIIVIAAMLIIRAVTRALGLGGLGSYTGARRYAPGYNFPWGGHGWSGNWNNSSDSSWSGGGGWSSGGSFGGGGGSFGGGSSGGGGASGSW